MDPDQMQAALRPAGLDSMRWCAGTLMRYSSAMATIQVREVPEESYEVLRRRARGAGQSMQAYMRDQLVAMARQPTKEEAIEEIEAVLSRLQAGEATAASIIEDLAAGRR